MNAGIAYNVRRKIIRFNTILKDKGKINELRYGVKVYWSKQIWQILKICWELKRLKLIERVKVHSDGILVHYSLPGKSSDNKLVGKMNVKCFNDIDTLRKKIDDIYSEASCEIIYDDQYFMLNNEERDRKRKRVEQVDEFEVGT